MNPTRFFEVRIRISVKLTHIRNSACQSDNQYFSGIFENHATSLLNRKCFFISKILYFWKIEFTKKVVRYYIFFSLFIMLISKTTSLGVIRKIRSEQLHDIALSWSSWSSITLYDRSAVLLSTAWSLLGRLIPFHRRQLIKSTTYSLYSRSACGGLQELDQASCHNAVQAFEVGFDSWGPWMSC